MEEAQMGNQARCGFLVLDRKGEYIKDTIDQRDNTVFGLQNHPRARERMVVVSARPEFARMKAQRLIADHLQPQFNIADIDPIDLADFLPGLTDKQAELVRDYAHVDGFYRKLLAEGQFGQADKSHWFEDFPGLFELNDKAKKQLREYEEAARAEGREELTEEERAKLQEAGGGGTKPEVLARAAGRVKRFCTNPFFGGSERGKRILAAPSCVNRVIHYLSRGMFVFIDMRGRSDEDYTMVAALFARRLLTENKEREDQDHIHGCIVMEEAHNILSDAELTKGNGTGSVFIELAREGRSSKLGFVLVTQQPDARSIAPQVAKTIDTVVAFNMPPDDAVHLRRLKSVFADLELQIANAAEFRGVVVKDAGPVDFQSMPVGSEYMAYCASGRLEEYIHQRMPANSIASEPETEDLPLSLEERLALLMRQRQEHIQPVALATMRVWREESYPGEEDIPS
jgi:hypothetical protein